MARLGASDRVTDFGTGDRRTGDRSAHSRALIHTVTHLWSLSGDAVCTIPLFPVSCTRILLLGANHFG